MPDTVICRKLATAEALTFFDWVTFSVESTFDISHYRKDAGYGERYLPDIHRIDDEGGGGELEHAGLMDTCIKGEFIWTITGGVSIGAYVVYTGYLFDSSTREASRHYEATGSRDRSWNFVTDVSLPVVF